MAELASWSFRPYHVPKTPSPGQQVVTVLSVCTPTLQAEGEENEAFYRDLPNLLQQVDSKGKLLISEDFNARVERDFEL